MGGLITDTKMAVSRYKPDFRSTTDTECVAGYLLPNDDVRLVLSPFPMADSMYQLERSRLSALDVSFC